MDPLFTLDGRRILVTGATGSLGSGIARACAAAGATVFPIWLLEGDGAAAEALAANGGVAIRADVAQPNEAERAVGVVLASGPLDGLVNVVGGYDGGNPVAELDIARWSRMFHLNLTTTVLMCRAALPSMLQAGRGRILNVTSRAAIRPAPGQAGYNASKAAVIAFTETVAEEVKASGVSCNALMPSTIDTPANRREMPAADHARWPSPEAIAPVAVFLLSDAAAVVNGAIVPVFGADR